MKIKYPYLFCLALLFVIHGNAQDNQVLVKKVPFIGIEQDDIHQIIQDSTGLLWMMSPEKWYTSDGEKIMEYPLPFIADDARYISGFYSTSPDGNFYLGGDSVRVFNPYSHSIIQSIGIAESYNGNGETPFLYNVTYSNDSIIWALLCPMKEFGFSYDYTVMQSRNGSPFKPIGIPEMKGTNITQNLAVKGDQLFISSYDTIFQYDTYGQLVKIHAFPLLASTPITAKSQVGKEAPVRFLHYIEKSANTDSYNFQDKKIGKALYSLNPQTNEFNSLPLPKMAGVEALLLDETEEFYWLIGDRMALYRFSPNNKKVIDYSKYIFQQHPDLPYFADQPLKVFQDKTKTLWVSTKTNGVLKLSTTVEPFARYLAGRKAYHFCKYGTCIIRGITADNQENIYFAYDFGIQKFNPETKELTSLQLNLSEELKAAYSLSFYNQKLYLNELEIDLETGNTTALIPGKSNHNITHYIDKERGQMWIADAGLLRKNGESIKLYHGDLKKRTFKQIGVFETPPNKLNQVSQFHFSQTTKTLFMATISNGVYELNMDGRIVQHIVDTKFIGGESLALALYEDDSQQLWIGHSKGISKMDMRTQEVTQLPYNAPDSIQVVYSIQRENNTFSWLGTDRGLYRLNVKTGELRNFKMFPSQAPMEFNRLSSYQNSDGTLYFGSVEGLFEFHPKSLVKEAQLDQQFPVQILRLSRFDNKKNAIVHTYDNLNTTNTFDIYPYHKYFSFDIFVPDFRNAEKNTYTYWLEGYEPNWSLPATSNTIRYDNLPPGKYTLHIKGGITADYYENSERKWQIIVHQVWYKTDWAYCLYLGAFLGLVYLFSRYQVNQQLEKADVRRIQELDNLKSQLYTNITHEFRTPLTVIMGMTNNISGHFQERKLIQRNSKRLLRLINQLLDLSKLDSGNLKIEFIQGDIIHYIQYLTESFYSMAEEKNIQLTFYPEVKELVMDYDETKIHHIVFNLLTNALKFTPEEGTVILHLQQLDKNNETWLQLKVSDTGIGISEKDLPKIFDRFYQGETPSNLKEVGTGIGLSLTNELVKMMDGKIAVKSNQGAGTEFLILLPVRRATNRVKKEKNQLKLTSPTKKELSESEKLIPILAAFNKDGASPSLLLIEDNRDVVTYIESLLKKEYQLTIARNGQEGIDKALEIIPDIIISDVMMPKKNGFEVCKTLKNDERSSHIPIILLTAKASAKDRIEGLKEGADAYLAKPFNKEELFIRLNKLVELRRVLQEQYSSNGFSLKRTNTIAKPSLEDIFLQKLIKVVENRLDDEQLAVVHLCRAANLSNMQVNRKLKALTGKTPSGFIRSIRLQKAMELLQTTQLNVSEIAYKVGFSNPSYFSRSFSEEFGHSPNVMRK